jgi:hypothetical protein
VRLSGTIVEPGHSRALLVDAEGKMELKAVGERIGGVEVVEIGQDTCVVLYQGNRITLKIDKQGAGP